MLKIGWSKTMMQNMVHPQEQLPIDEITSPLGAQLLEFCESELFPETLQNSEVASSSNCCNYEEHSSYNPTNLSITADMNNNYNNNNNVDNNNNNNNNNNNIKSLITTANSAPHNGGPSLIFDQSDNDISASIDFNTSSFSISHNQYLNNNNNNNEQFNIPSLNTQLPLDGSLHMNHHQYIPKLGPPMPTGFEDECGLPSMPSYLRMRSTSSPSCALMDPNIAPYLPSVGMNAAFSAESSGIFTGNGLMLGNGIPHHQELEFQGDNGGLFLPDSMQTVFNCSTELQALSSESQHLVHGGGAGNTSLASEITSLEDPTFKVGKLSVEERKRKIHRYMKKRKERNFSKKIKYACRKTLADSRPRVRGRFAKNDEQGEINARTNEYDTDEDVSLYSNQLPIIQTRGICQFKNSTRVVVKEEEDLDSSDKFAHISGVNSFKCSYPSNPGFEHSNSGSSDSTILEQLMNISN